MESHHLAELCLFKRKLKEKLGTQISIIIKKNYNNQCQPLLLSYQIVFYFIMPFIRVFCPTLKVVVLANHNVFCIFWHCATRTDDTPAFLFTKKKVNNIWVCILISVPWFCIWFYLNNKNYIAVCNANNKKNYQTCRSWARR